MRWEWVNTVSGITHKISRLNATKMIKRDTERMSYGAQSLSHKETQNLK